MQNRRRKSLLTTLRKYSTLIEIFEKTLKSNQTDLKALFYTPLQMPGIKLPLTKD